MSKVKKEVKKVKSFQKYTFEIVHYEDGSSVMNRKNDGFSVVEMLGIASIISSNMMEIFKSAFKPTDEINRVSKNSPLIHQPK